MKTNVLLFVLLFAFTFLGSGCIAKQAADDQKDRPMLPAFSFEDRAGIVHTQDSLKGTPLMVNTWASWCAFCKEELVDFAELQALFGDNIRIVAINRGESKEKAEAFLEERDIEDGLLYLFDPNDNFYRSIGGFSMPETLFVDADGSIVFQKRGVLTKEDVINKVNELWQLQP